MARRNIRNIAEERGRKAVWAAWALAAVVCCAMTVDALSKGPLTRFALGFADGVQEHHNKEVKRHLSAEELQELKKPPSNTLQNAKEAEKPKEPQAEQSDIGGLIRANASRFRKEQGQAFAAQEELERLRIENQRRKEQGLEPIKSASEGNSCKVDVAIGIQKGLKNGALKYIATACSILGYPLDKGFATAMRESSLNTEVKHKKTGAGSLFQIMPDTAHEYFFENVKLILNNLDRLDLSKGQKKEIRNLAEQIKKKVSEEVKASAFNIMMYPAVNALAALSETQKAEAELAKWWSPAFKNAMEAEKINLEEVFPCWHAMKNNWGTRGIARMIEYALLSPDAPMREVMVQIEREGLLLFKKPNVDKAEFFKKAEEKATSKWEQNVVDPNGSIGDYMAKENAKALATCAEFNKELVVLAKDPKHAESLVGLKGYLKGLKVDRHRAKEGPKKPSQKTAQNALISGPGKS